MHLYTHSVYTRTHARALSLTHTNARARAHTHTHTHTGAACCAWKQIITSGVFVVSYYFTLALALAKHDGLY